MKNRIIVLLVSLLVIVPFSCNEDDYKVQNIPGAGGELTTGAFLRTISIDNNFIDLFSIEESVIGVTVEAVSPDNGSQVASINAYVSYQDNNESNGTVEVNEVAVGSYDSSTFSVDAESGLPRVSISANAASFVGEMGLDTSALLPGDVFFLRLEAVMEDGRTFSNNDIGADITGGFYSSPFIYGNSVACALPDGFAEGEYILETTQVGIFGVSSFVEGPVTLVASGATTRTMTISTYPAFGPFGPVDITLDLVCGEVIVPTGQGMGAGCGGEATVGPPSGPNATFDINDDSVIEVNFTDDETGGCGTAQASIRLTRA